MKIIIMFLISLNIFSEALTLQLVREIPNDVKDITLDIKKLDSKDYLVGVGIVAGGLILYNFDEDIREFSQKHQSKELDNLAPIFRKFGEFYPPLILLGTGYLFGNEKSITTGVYSMESSLLALGIISVGKNIFGRSRPYNNDGSNSWFNDTFNDDYSSFPSGHSAVAFATATIISEMYKDKKGIPELMYSLATLTALSRIYNDKHWSSDVFTGSIIGYLTGQAVLKAKKENGYIFPKGDSKSIGFTFGGNFGK